MFLIFVFPRVSFIPLRQDGSICGTRPKSVLSLGCTIPNFQSSDFGGDLSQAQLKYCANDVIYLHKIHDELTKILVREKRNELYKDCLRFLKTRVDLDLSLFKEDIWSH